MTNQVSAVTNTIITEQHSAIWEFMSQHTSEIIVSILTAGSHIIHNKEFVQIILDNQTSTPVVVRRVALVDDGRPIYGCWHDPIRMDMRDYTETVNTGVRIAPHGFGVWHYTGPEFTSEVSPVVRTCEIEFEYAGNGDTVHVHTMRTPESMGKTFQDIFEFWWRFVQKKHGKEPPQQGH